MNAPLELVVLISGGGTTLRNLLAHIDSGSLDAKINRVISSQPEVGGLAIAEAAGIETCVIERRHFATAEEYGDRLFEACREADPHLIAMCGFLKFVPIPADFANRVMNIHPSLVPAFCGKGFYGLHVHQAVLEYGAKVSGCTVHFVDNEFDHGPIIVQRTVPVLDDDSPTTLAERVFAAECEAYPEALRLFAAGRLHVEGRRVRIASA